MSVVNYSFEFRLGHKFWASIFISNLFIIRGEDHLCGHLLVLFYQILQRELIHLVTMKSHSK